jgi:hypothetical protein
MTAKEPIEPTSLKRLVSHDGRIQFVYREDVHRNAKHEIYDLIVCSWCNNQVFLFHRKNLKKSLKGNDGRRLPHCGCQIKDRKQLLDDYRKDMPVAEIALKHGLSRSSVLRIARAAGLPPKTRILNGSRVVTDYRIVAEILLTADTRQVSDKLKVTRQRVRTAIDKYMTKITKPPVG